MEKLDRLGWAAGQVIEAFGARIGVRTNDPHELAWLATVFPPGWNAGVGPEVETLLSVRFPQGSARPGLRRYYLLYEGPVRLVRTLDRNELLEAFASHVHRLVAASSPLVFIHAGVVSWEGQAVVLPGRSLAGKTTLVTAFLRAGAEYYSDEYAVLEENGLVRPYPKPLGIRQGEGVIQQFRPAEELGVRVGCGPVPVAAVIMARYRAGARWRPRRLSAGQALLTLLEHCASAQRRPKVAIETAKRMIAGATLLQGMRGEAEETVPLLLRRLGKRNPNAIDTMR